MDYKDIKILLEKYWRYETSVEEEKSLRDFFSNSQVPEELLPFKNLFTYYSTLSQLSPEAEFSPRMRRKSDDASKPHQIRAVRTAWYYKAAAAIILVLTLFVINDRVAKIRRETAIIVKDTFRDPKEALDETKRILFSVSRELIKGEKEAVKLGEFSRAEDKFRKSKPEDK